MVSPNVTRILDAADSLDAAEQQELRRLLDERAARAALARDEDRLAQILIERGVIGAIRRKPTQEELVKFDAWKPVPISGEPMSQTIIQDRR